jgi:hypothetical protein
MVEAQFDRPDSKTIVSAYFKSHLEAFAIQRRLSAVSKSIAADLLDFEVAICGG